MAFHGKQGKITFAGANVVANVTAWSINVTCDVAESSIMDQTTPAATTHWKEYMPGFLDWTATIETDAPAAAFDPDLDTDFAQDDNGIAVVLESTSSTVGGRKYSGNGIITNITPSANKDETVKLTYAVQGSGTLTEAAVT